MFKRIFAVIIVLSFISVIGCKKNETENKDAQSESLAVKYAKWPYGPIQTNQ